MRLEAESFGTPVAAPGSEWAQRLLRTEASATQAMLRIVLGIVLLPHGLQHTVGWFDGPGFAGTLAWMTGSLGIPAPIAAFGIATELVGPLLLVAGAGGRLAGVLLAGFMAVAGATHAGNGFFLNWVGAMPAGAEGFEYHLLACAMAAAVAIGGSGSLSVDRLLARRRGA